MNKKRSTPGVRTKKEAEVSLVRSSAAEYLTFVAASGAGGVEAVYADENVWLSQKMMGLLYDVDVRTISYHLKNVFADHELEENSVIQYFRITAADGKTYDTQHYNLSAIIAVGYKVNSERAVQFRKWATGIIPWRPAGRRCFSNSSSLRTRTGTLSCHNVHPNTRNSRRGFITRERQSKITAQSSPFVASGSTKSDSLGGLSGMMLGKLCWSGW